jgi:hypothetical protein
MKKYQISIVSYITLVISFITPFITSAQGEAVRPAHIGFVYPLSTNGINAGQYSNVFSLHAISGVSKNEMAFTVAGIYSIVKQNVTGVQISGVYNHAGNSVRGAQIAGLGNYAGNYVKGAQIASVFNKTDTVNSQVSAVINIARDVNGAQVSGFINKAENVNAQVAGFLNIAKKVKGVQISGFINIADSSDYPIGIINLVKNGEKAIGLSYDETGTTLVTFRSGGRVLYSIIGLGYNLKDAYRDYYAFEAGFGANWPVTKSFGIKTELTNQVLTDFNEDPYAKHSLRILPSIKLGSRIEIFAGPSLNFVEFDRDDHEGFVKNYIWKNKNIDDDFHGFHLGYNVGLQIGL